MAGEINFQVDAETRGAEQGLEAVADGLDDAAKAADGLGDEGKKAGDKVEDAAKDAAKVIERDLDNALKDVAKTAKKTGDDIGDDIKRGARDASAATDELKDSARQNAIETAASFDGSAQALGDGFQGAAAEALSGFGPLGVAGGLALAAGFGAFRAAVENDAALSKQAIADMYDDMLDSGADFLSKEYVADQLAKIYQGADDAAIKIDELRSLASAADIPEPLLARALVGDAQARQEVTSEIARQRLKINEALDDATAKGGNIAPVLAPAIQALLDIEAQVDGTAEGFSTAQKNADAARAAINGVIGATQGAASSAEDARAKYDGLGRKIAELPKSVSIPITADPTSFQRTIREIQNGVYQVVINGRPGRSFE